MLLMITCKRTHCDIYCCLSCSCSLQAQVQVCVTVFKTKKDNLFIYISFMLFLAFSCQMKRVEDNKKTESGPILAKSSKLGSNTPPWPKHALFDVKSMFWPVQNNIILHRPKHAIFCPKHGNSCWKIQTFDRKLISLCPIRASFLSHTSSSGRKRLKIKWKIYIAFKFLNFEHSCAYCVVEFNSCHAASG